jgi:hypothetical protein
MSDFLERKYHYRTTAFMKVDIGIIAGLVFWCLTPLLTIFQLFCGCQFYWWRKLEYPETILQINHSLIGQTMILVMMYVETIYIF